MDAFNYACAQVRYSIPREVLEKVFLLGSEYWRIAAGMNVDEQIKELVIRPRVSIDCNIVSGVMEVLDLTTVERFSPKPGYYIYKIPMSITDGRTILSPLSLHYFNPESVSYGYARTYASNVYTGLGGNPANTSAAMSTASGIVNAMDNIPIVSTARLRLRGRNVVEVHDSVMPPPNTYLRCMMELNEDMSNLDMASLPAFANLVILATKSYIYNTMVIQMDRGVLEMGQELGALKEVISSYQDCEQQYNEFLRDEMAAILFMSDRARYARFSALMVGGYR